MAATEKPEIFLLSLAFQSFLDNSYSSLIDNLHNSAHLKRNNPRAIIVTDEGLTEARNKTALEKVLAYLQNGGLVIVGLHFPSFTNMPAFDKFFDEGFGLPWKRGDYHRTTFQFNPSSILPTGMATLSVPAPYSMKVLHVKNARPHEKIFVPLPEATTESHVFPPSYVDQTQAAVVGAGIGSGYLVYIGDVNPEQGSDRIILSLCGLRGI